MANIDENKKDQKELLQLVSFRGDRGQFRLGQDHDAQDHQSPDRTGQRRDPDRR